MGKEFNTAPQSVPAVATKYRRIQTAIPHPDSVSVLDRLRKIEPLSMRGMPPIVWDRAEDIFVYDKYGNQWLDWSSGVLVTNAGHGAPEIKKAIIDQVNTGLIHSYVFANERRAELVELLASVSPEGTRHRLSPQHRVGSDGVRDQTLPHPRHQSRRQGKDRNHRI
jgi:4-aminobutyrate aminotransferase/(S)-3-amino-2-methylpropionate transaminase